MVISVSQCTAPPPLHKLSGQRRRVLLRDPAVLPVSCKREGPAGPGIGDVTCTVKGARLTAHKLMGDRGRWDTAEGTDIDWPKFMGKKKDELRRLNGVYNKMLNNAGVTYLEGRGKLLDRHTVDVDGKKYTARFLPPSVFFYPLAVGSADQEQFDRGVFDVRVSPTLTVHILPPSPF